ncbi:uncharacterized protein L201_002292 [Kwoniella dendrophila CBS 6074]|uniref:Nodulin-like domain-containing protein n=1 Tax=Kwoniella dendrophila CBS 6074 TaxID=1295534 RepID=A0AAX4JSF2_9TREE
MSNHTPSLGSTSSRPPSRPRLSSRTRLFDESETKDKMSFLSSIKWESVNPFSDQWDDIERKRLGVFIMCFIVGLASGSNYVYSAYAPQLASKLNVSSTVGNLIGLAGNLGVYLTGPFWGKIVDSKGQRIPLLIGGLCCLIGYSILYQFFIGSISIRSTDSSSDIHSDPSKIRLFLLEFSMFLTGCGGSSGISASVNATAKSFSDKTRASATGTVLAGFGLSAFLFSTLGHSLFKGNPEGLLLLLSFGTGLPMLLGSLIIKPIPPPKSTDSLTSISYQQLNNNDDNDDNDDMMIEEGGINRPTVIVNHPAEEFEYQSNYNFITNRHDLVDEDDRLEDTGPLSRTSSLELTRSRSPGSRNRYINHGHSHSLPHSHLSTEMHSHAHFSDNDDIIQPTIEESSNPILSSSSSSKPFHHPGYGHKRTTSILSISPSSLTSTPLDLIKSLDFWILFLTLALLCGTGLMYINNAGTVTLALGRQGLKQYDKHKISSYQSKQVGLVSIWNCLGRIIGGVVPDFGKSRYGIRRVWFLPIVSIIFTISQITALQTTQIQSLWIVSTLLGLAYGSMFNIMPMLILEWFGMKHFSQNWGWVAVAPVLGSNAFNLLFGKIYDSHTVGKIGSSDDENTTNGDIIIVEVVKRMILSKRDGGAIPDDGKHGCLVGEECYGTAFKISTIGTLIAFVLSIWAGIRREKISRERRKAM